MVSGEEKAFSDKGGGGGAERLKKAWKQPLDLVCQVDAAIYGSGGVARYAKSMIGGLVSYGQSPKLFWVEQATQAERKDLFKKELERLIYVPLASKFARTRRFKWLMLIAEKMEQLRVYSNINSLLGEHKFYWSMCHRLCDVSGPKRIVTIHDAIAALSDRYHKQDEIKEFSKFLSLTRKLADLLFVPSEATKEDLVKRLRFPQDIIEVLPSPLDPIFLDPPKDLPKPTFKNPYILSVGTLGVRKDVKGLFEAYQMFRKEVPDKVLLVLVGRTSANLMRLKELFESSPYGSDVVHIGFVDDLTLASLYKNATLLCYPSLAEGFGYPVAEAMALGVPVVSYKLPSIEWITESRAAKLVPIGDNNALAKAMLEVAQSRGVSEQLSRHGRLIAKRFAPRKLAMKAVKIIRDRFATSEG